MFGLPIRSVMEPRKLVLASPQASVREAARLMMDSRVGAVLVVSEGRLVGIFTERDIVYRVTAADRDPRTTRLGEVMTPQPKTLAPEESTTEPVTEPVMFWENPACAQSNSNAPASAFDLEIMQPPAGLIIFAVRPASQSRDNTLIWKKSGSGSSAWAMWARARWPYLRKMPIRSPSSWDSA